MSSAETLLAEGLIPLSHAAKRVPGAKGAATANPSTLFRWVTGGVPLPNGDRLKLEAVKRGRHWFTSAAALTRFLDRQTNAYTAPVPRTPMFTTPTQKREAATRAAAELKRLGA